MNASVHIPGSSFLELTLSDIQRIHAAIVQAVKSGRISQTRIDEAVQKILTLKERCTNSVDFNISSINTEEDQKLALDIASRALKVTQKKSITLDDKKLLILAPLLIKESLDQTSLLKLGKETDVFFFNSLFRSTADREKSEQLAQAADVLLFCCYNAWKNPSQIALVQSLLDSGKPVILLVERDSLDAALFPQADMIFTTFSPTVPSIQAVCNQLNNSIFFTNKS